MQKARWDPYRVILPVKQVDTHELSLSVGVSQSCKTEVCQKLLFEEMCIGNEMSDSLPLTFLWLFAALCLLSYKFIICHLLMTEPFRNVSTKQGETIILFNILLIFKRFDGWYAQGVSAKLKNQII